MYRQARLLSRPNSSHVGTRHPQFLEYSLGIVLYGASWCLASRSRRIARRITSRRDVKLAEAVIVGVLLRT